MISATVFISKYSHPPHVHVYHSLEETEIALTKPCSTQQLAQALEVARQYMHDLKVRFRSHAYINVLQGYTRSHKIQGA